ncbi:MAG: hypothetical protein NUV98_04745 [Candidatus Roizmanbacteria bacterium]|nr:hypothetical protein [Candidatus Roizmanbacteria bacterium]
MDSHDQSFINSSPSSDITDEKEVTSPEHHAPKGLIIFVIGFIFLVVGVGLAIRFFLPQIFVNFYKELNYSKSKTPWLYAEPTMRSIKQPEDLSQYPHYSYYGIAFRVPWNNEPEVKNYEQSTTLRFSDERVLIIHDPILSVDIAAAMTSGEEADQVRELFGAEHFENDYKLKKLILSSTPDEITFLTSGKEATAKLVLVTLKNALLISESKTVYDFHADNVVGFQYGDPGNDGGVVIDYYDRAYSPYSLIISGKELTQEEVDLIISSISFEDDRAEKSSTDQIPVTSQTPGTSKTVQPTDAVTIISPTQEPIIASNFASLGAQIVEEGVTAHITSAHVSGSQMSISVTFKNTSANAASVRPIRLSMYNDTHGTANKEGYLEVPLNPGESRSFILTYDTLPGSSLIFKYATDSGIVDLATYNQ